MVTLYDLIDTALSTHEVRADGTLAPLLAKSRRAPMRSAVKRYGALLGIDPAKAQPPDYHRPDQEVRSLIETKAPATLAPTTIRNLTNDVLWLLRTAVDQGWLEPLPAPLLSWRQRLPYPGSWVRRGEQGYTPKYRLDLKDCPQALQDELTAYIAWCEAPFARNRDRRVAKRPTTSRKSYNTMLRLAGFAARIMHEPVDTLTLRSLCQPDIIEAFINWWLTERRQKMTAGLEQYLLIPKTIAKHWLKDKDLADTLTKMLRALPPKQAVRNKESRWLTLAQLEEVGLSLYPLNARRLQDYPVLKQPRYNRRHSKRWTALYVAFSLIIRLLIRLPMRQRCVREMLLGKNLYQDNAGVWQVLFVGAELKVAQRRGQENRYEFPFPSDLVPLLEEYLQEWRPKIARPDDLHVFMNSHGNPFTVAKEVGELIARVTYRFTGVAVTPHMIRDIFATEWLERYPGDVAGVARYLGNTEAMVWAHYAHIIKRDVDQRAEAFRQQTFAPHRATSR
jgi:integrase